MRLHRVLPLALVVLQVALLTACQPPLEVTLASSNEHLPGPAFLIDEPSQDGGPPRYDVIRVLAEDGTQVWHVRALSFDGTRGRRVVYGEAPEGFETVQSPQPLESGRLYSISVSGEASGALRFVVDPDGSVHPEKE
ncbi:hypothetical protein [Corallococcus aberystwythensis]|uniref:Lipoprotein n=1 Tax=Corallococcus aberystwythensis TaxID=2316722 RepID=A0A3A8R4F6_9BACT|nr:hypothetical protein [Corallococcus aberystwythensis]RKH73705.1 hypothetical protein D7W81_03360 [Corallococcus aberystwythensis]